jgi:hypothetical protein
MTGLATVTDRAAQSASARRVGLKVRMDRGDEEEMKGGNEKWVKKPVKKLPNFYREIAVLYQSCLSASILLLSVISRDPPLCCGTTTQASNRVNLVAISAVLFKDECLHAVVAAFAYLTFSPRCGRGFPARTGMIPFLLRYYVDIRFGFGSFYASVPASVFVSALHPFFSSASARHPIVFWIFKP